MSPSRKPLEPGTLVGGYQLVKPISKGGFSLIYLALELDSGDQVVLKEYMPNKIASRDHRGCIVPASAALAESLERGRKLFFLEIKALASLQHPNIVQVRDFFLANATAYLVMQYERGKNLGSYVKARRGDLSATFLLGVFLPILDALAMLHRRSMVHLDVKPGNIHLRYGNAPILLDLGAVHSLAEGRPQRGQIVTPGFSPVEQYYNRGDIGPWTDVYAAGASMRKCMDGKTPPPAVDRHDNDTLMPATLQFRDRYPAFLLEAVDWAMQMEPDRRPQNAGELLESLRRSVSDLPKAGPTEARSKARDAANLFGPG